MLKTAVLTDSGSGLSPQEAKEKGIYLIPLLVLIDGKSYNDGQDISTLDVYQALSDKKYPKTSTPLYMNIEDLVRQIKADGFDLIIATPLSAGLSSTHQSIRLAGQEVGIEIEFVDVFSTCMIQKHVSILAQTLVNEGKSKTEIVESLNKVIKSANTLILPNDLDHLKVGGRLTPLAASLAEMFKIRPILQLNASTKGKIDVFAKVRTERKALEEAIDTLHGSFKGKNCSIYIIHSHAAPRTEVTKALLIERGYDPSRIFINDIAAVIASHTGLDCLGIQFIESTDQTKP
jgi:DegV family protein with EDD domain